MPSRSKAKPKVSSKTASAKKRSSAKSSSKKSSARKKGPSKKASSSTTKTSSTKAPSKKTSGNKASSGEKKTSSKKTTSVRKASPKNASPARSTGKVAGASRGSALKPGDRAPAFSLQGDDGKTYSLASMKGKRFVLYFYPKDDTPGCTKEACDFRDHHGAFERARVTVLGVSGDSIQSHGKFRGKYDLPFVLLSDPGREVAKAYGALGLKSLYGRTFEGIIRSTFVVGGDGKIEAAFSPVKVPGHVEAVLGAVASG